MIVFPLPPLNPIEEQDNVDDAEQDEEEEEEMMDTTALLAPSPTTTTSLPKHHQRTNHIQVIANETDEDDAVSATTMLPPSIRNDKHDPASTATEEIASGTNMVLGVHGVRLKHFEHVVACLLTTKITTTNATTADDCHEDDSEESGSCTNTSSTCSGSLLRPQYVQLPPMVVPEWSTPATVIDANYDDDHEITTRMIQPACGCWPWDELPPAARVYGTRPGQLAHALRASRKEDQIRSMLQCILPLIRPTTNIDQSSSMFTIVDFGGGSGHLSIPLALMRPSCRIVCVDLGKQSLELLHQKAAHCCCCHHDSSSASAATTTTTTTAAAAAAAVANDMAEEPSISFSPATTTNNTNTNQMDFNDDPRWRQTAISNLWTFHGPAQAYHNVGGSSNFNNHSHPDYPLDMAVALHLCGEATDVVLRLAGEREAVAIVAAPCCVGKLQQKTATPASSSSNNKKNHGNCNPYIFQATGQNAPTVQYPQSRVFRTRLTQRCDWDALAKAADYSDATEFRTARNAARRTAKALLELDRCLFLQEQYHYQTVLTRMQPWEASPKNDILVAWKLPRSASKAAALHEPPPALPSILDCPIDLECQADIDLTMEHLMLSSKQVTVSDSERIQKDTVDWTRDEMECTRRQLTEFLDRTRNDPTATMIFPTGMGGRQRKLVHYTAAQLNLAHWSQGSKDSEKTVAVRRKWDKPKLPQQPPTITTMATGDKQ